MIAGIRTAYRRLGHNKMKIIRPVTITDSVFRSSNIPEADQAEWVSSTTYHVDDLVMVTTTANGAATATHKIYKSAHSNAGNDPTIDTGTNWTEVSSTNRWKMFDTVVQDQTVADTGTSTITFAVTVANSGGNKYFIDNTLQATVSLNEGRTYRFDQSDASNAGHPLRFSTTPNGTHGGGSEYTTGVTTVGTPGNAGAYTQIVVASGAPTLYYYCSVHSGMGGTANTTLATQIATILQSPTVVNSLALLNLEGSDVVITVTDAVEGVVYNQTYNLTSYSGIQDWYSYFFEPIVRRDQLAITDLPPYSNASIAVTINSTTAAKAGALIIGQFADIGLSQHGASLSIIDYSTKTTDAQGRISITEGPYADKMEVDVILDTSQIGAANTVLTSLRTTPAVFIAEDNNDDLLIYGYYREFDIILSNPTISRISLEIEGLV